jgi:hypothetical protein
VPGQGIRTYPDRRLGVGELLTDTLQRVPREPSGLPGLTSSNDPTDDKDNRYDRSEPHPDPDQDRHLVVRALAAI